MWNHFLILLSGSMIAFQGFLVVRYRRPFRIVFLAFWAGLLHAELTKSEDLYPFLVGCLVVGIVMRRREPANWARIIERERARQQKPSPSGHGIWDREIDGQGPDAEKRK